VNRQEAEKLSDRELLLHVVDELHSFRTEWVLAMHYLHGVNLSMGRKAEADEIARQVAERRPGTNISQEEIKTDPEAVSGSPV
jgi:hypothetical protein